MAIWWEGVQRLLSRRVALVKAGMWEAEKGVDSSEERGHRRTSWDASAVVGTDNVGLGEGTGVQDQRLNSGG